MNKVPYIAYITLDKRFAYDHIYLKPNQTYESTVFTFDPEQDSLRLKWELLPEADVQDGNAGKQVKPLPLRGLLQRQDDRHVVLQTPKREGAYRLFVYVYDGQNNLATANIPFYVSHNPLQ